MFNASKNMEEMGEALMKLMAAAGMAAIRRMSATLTPEALMEGTQESIRTSMKEALMEIIGGGSSFASDLIDKFYQELDDDALIEKVAPSIAAAMVDYYKDQGADSLIDAIVEEMDFDNLQELVAEKVASRINLNE